MKNPTSVLVVDDEEVVCESCSRILSKEGFAVDTCTSSQDGLKAAKASDYSAILLDLKMRDMDGVQFLDQLRKTNSEVPVIVITGYPSQDTANATMNLGVYDYIPKPFTPDEIADSVKRATHRARPAPKAAPAEPAPAVKVPAWEPSAETYRFFDESWFLLGEDASIRVGAVLPRSVEGAPRAVELPAVGSMVYRGLPLAALHFDNQTRRVIPAPVSGRVVEINPKIAESPGSLVQDLTCGPWLTRIQTTQLSEDLLFCRTRNVVFAASDDSRTQKERADLARLGCKVHFVQDRSATLDALKSHESALLLVDASSFGKEGPDLVKEANRLLPKSKIVVLAGSDSGLEAAYRTHKIFFYAVKPFEDMEILDILSNAFRLPERPAIPEETESKFLPKWLSRIHITNRKGSKVTLLCFGELLLYHKGPGRQLVGKILEHSFPLETTRGVEKGTASDSFGQTRIRNEANKCDRLIVLFSDDARGIPGQLSIDAHRDLFTALGTEEQRKLTTLCVEAKAGSGPLSFDVRTTDSLAEHILREMVSR